MTKIRCKYTNKEFEEDIGMRTIMKCPYCKCFIEFNYGFIGLSFDVGIEISNKIGHEIIYNKNN